jgi:hypothetical protein
MNDGVLIHVGINFIFSPAPNVNKRKALDFQHSLLESGVEVSQSKYKESEVIVLFTEPTQIEAKVAVLNPGVGQLVVVGPRAPGDVHIFGLHANAIVQAYRATWPLQKSLQLLHCDATLRLLYETRRDHAFQELWQVRLRQSDESLAILGPNILGGGLRFVMTSPAAEAEPYLAEVKIESYLEDTSKIYVEAQFKWDSMRPDAQFDTLERLTKINSYIDNNVRSFMSWEETDDSGQ